jgi:MFS transporter, DHA1 family, multidrug resistance protein
VLLVSVWPTIFLVLAGYAMLTGALLEARLFRHLPRQAPRPWQPLHALVTNYRHVLGHGSAMLLILLQALIFGILMVYLTHAPLLLKDWLGLGNAGFSAVFAATVTAMAGVALLNRRLLARWLPGQILWVSVRAQTLAVLVLVAVVTLPLPRWLLIPAIMCVIGAQGAIAPNIQAGVMQYFRELGGTAAALMGAVQFAGGGVLSGAVALAARGEVPLVTAAMLVCSVAATLLMIPVARRLKVTPAPP